MRTIIWMILTLFSWDSVKEICEPTEFDIIFNAAMRNNCHGDNLRILFAIRKAENGGPGKEFGIKHPRAWNTNLDTQAGWAADSIVKNRKRWQNAGRPKAFIDFLADRYCPKIIDPVGHENWKKNVWFFYERMVSK